MKNRWTLLLIVMLGAYVSCGFLGCGEPRNLPPKHWFQFSNDENLDSLIAWTIVLAMFGIGVSVAAGIFLPVKKLAIAIGAGFGSIITLALFVKTILPYLPFVVIGMCAIAVIVGIIYFRRYVLAMHAAVGFGFDMEKANTELEAQKVIEDHAKEQAARGVKPLIEKALTKIKAKAKKIT